MADILGRLLLFDRSGSGRWVVTQRVEAAAQAHEMGAIEIQPLDGGPARRSATDDVGKVVTPGELLLPALLPGVVERHLLSSGRIPCHGRGILAAITASAGIGKVRQVVTAPARTRLNMIDRKRIGRVAIRGATVLTATPCPRDDRLPLPRREASPSPARPQPDPAPR